MSDTATITQTITAKRIVGESQRMNFLVEHFGKAFLAAEMMLYNHMQQLCSSYNGGLWDFFTLSNGGVFLAPAAEGTYLISSPNGVSEEVSEEGAGIIATLFMLGELSQRTHGFNNVLCEKVVDYYHHLRSYAQESAEADAIMMIID